VLCFCSSGDDITSDQSALPNAVHTLPAKEDPSPSLSAVLDMDMSASVRMHRFLDIAARFFASTSMSGVVSCDKS
jgi:hypothetical protein